MSICGSHAPQVACLDEEPVVHAFQTVEPKRAGLGGSYETSAVEFQGETSKESDAGVIDAGGGMQGGGEGEPLFPRALILCGFDPRHFPDPAIPPTDD